MADSEWMDGYHEGFDDGRKDGYNRGLEGAAKIVGDSAVAWDGVAAVAANELFKLICAEIEERDGE